MNAAYALVIPRLFNGFLLVTYASLSVLGAEGFPPGVLGDVGAHLKAVVNSHASIYTETGHFRGKIAFIRSKGWNESCLYDDRYNPPDPSYYRDGQLVFDLDEAYELAREALP